MASSEHDRGTVAATLCCRRGNSFKFGRNKSHLVVVT